MNDFTPADAAGVVIYADAYGKYTVARVFVRGGTCHEGSAKREVEFVTVTDGRSFGAASRAAANEMELIAHDIPRRKVSLNAPEASKLKVVI